MLRLSIELGKAIKAHVDGSVRVASREERMDACPLECSDGIANVLDVDHVVDLELAKDYRSVAITVFHAKSDPSEGSISCAYADGRVSCATKELVSLFTKRDALPPLDTAALEAAFRALAPRMLRCGAGLEPAIATFRVTQEGRVTDVRVEPRTIQRKKPYPCMARVVESLRVGPFSADKPVSYRMPLPYE